eukprot:ANDGO_00537.mRNA.1 Phosphatidylinositide phosphatase SAC1
MHELDLFVLESAIVIRAQSLPAQAPKSAPSAEKCLIVDRSDGGISECDSGSLSPSLVSELSSASPMHVSALLGALMLPSGLYLVVSCRRTPIAQLFGNTLYSFSEMQCIATCISSRFISSDAPYVSRIQAALDQGFFFGSYSYDITVSLEQNSAFSKQAASAAAASTTNKVSNSSQNNNSNNTNSSSNSSSGTRKRKNHLFFWNAHLTSALPLPIASTWTVRMIRGFVASYYSKAGGFSFVMISRQSPQRAGTRYYRRGADPQTSHVANFTETEQIIVDHKTHAAESLVQIRGSIPLRWSQRPNMKYKPKPRILGDAVSNNQIAFQHLKSVSGDYGKVTCVDLVDQKGSEGAISAAFKSAVLNASSLPVVYEGFDFHKECSKMRYDRLSLLVSRLQQPIHDSLYSCTLNDTETVVEKTMLSPSAVIRTNCMDCLDRTNVTQAQIARTRTQALELLTRDPLFDIAFKHAWADNADAISTLYAGTGALKTDFTRTGQRSRAGAIRDGVNSITRYYLNNFKDGLRQDGVDLLVGNVIVKKGQGFPVSGGDYGHILLVLIVLALIGMVTVNPIVFSACIVLLIVLAVKLPASFVNDPVLMNEDPWNATAAAVTGVSTAAGMNSSISNKQTRKSD